MVEPILGGVGEQERLTPWVTYFLVLINAIVWAYELVASGSPLGPSDQVLSGLSFYWPDVLPHAVGGTVGADWSLLFLSMFTHGSWDHIIGNMAFLLAFGPKVENLFASHPRRYLGHFGFLVFYLLGGSLAAFWFVASGGVYEGAIGASGAIAFVLGIYWWAFPKSVVTVPLSSQKVRAFYYLGFWFLMQAGLDLYGAGGGVAYSAHVGGFLFGLFLAWSYRFRRFDETSFGLLERPWKLSPRDALDALGALIF